MIRGKYLTSQEDIQPVLRVREAVCRAENLPGGRDAYDRMAVYALAYDAEGAPAGCGRLYLSDDHFEISMVGVLPEKRGMGLGDLVMRMLLFRAQELNAAEVYARIPPASEAFYRRFGFERTARAPEGCGDACLFLRARLDDVARCGCRGHAER